MTNFLLDKRESYRKKPCLSFVHCITLIKEKITTTKTTTSKIIDLKYTNKYGKL